MAGKHVAAWENSDDPLDGFAWNERTTKAYADGRNGVAADHPAGSDAARAYAAGVALAAEPAQAFEAGAPAVASTVDVYIGNGPHNIADVPGLPNHAVADVRAETHQNDITETGGPFLAQTGDVLTEIGIYGDNLSGVQVQLEVAVYDASVISGDNWSPDNRISPVQTFTWAGTTAGVRETTGLSIALVNGTRYMVGCVVSDPPSSSNPQLKDCGTLFGVAGRVSRGAVAGALTDPWVDDGQGFTDNLVMWAKVSRQA